MGDETWERGEEEDSVDDDEEEMKTIEKEKRRNHMKKQQRKQLKLIGWGTMGGRKKGGNHGRKEKN